MITKQIDHAGVALKKLVQQFKDKPKLAAFLSVFLKQMQDVEDAFWTLYVDRRLANAVGRNLDICGKIVGQPRGNSVDDDEYRLRIRARIRTNLSNGTPKDIYAVFKVLLPVVLTRLVPGYPAGFEFFIDNPITAAYAALYAQFLGDAKAAGVGANLIWYPIEDDSSFMCENVCTYLTVLSDDGPGPRELHVISTAGFPDSGGLLVAGGVDGHDEEVSYTSKSATAFECVYVENTHAINTSVAWLDAPTGLGFSSTSNTSLGGQMAGAIATG